MYMRVFDRDLSAPKQYRKGTHRTCDPLETVRRYEPVAPVIGLTRLANITGLDVIGIPVWVGIRPNSRGLSTSQGKGLTDAAAKASALMESVENWHAENIDRPVRADSYEGLRRTMPVVDLDGLSYYEDAPPRPDLPMPWIEGYDLLRNETCWVPLECVSTNYVVSARLTSANSFVQSSNGLSSGNRLLEAIAAR
jgi:YcaO-like protein with predicted kinase domain